MPYISGHTIRRMATLADADAIWGTVSPAGDFVTRLTPIIADDITATLGAGGAGIPVHGSLGHELPSTGLTGQRDLIAAIGIVGHDQVLQHQRGDVDGKSTVRQQTECLTETAPIGIDQPEDDGLAAYAWVLQGEPLIVAQVGVAFGEAVGSDCRTLADHIGAAGSGQGASIADVLVLEVHLALGDKVAGGTDLS